MAEPERAVSKTSPNEPGTSFFIVVSKLRYRRHDRGSDENRPMERTIHSHAGTKILPSHTCEAGGSQAPATVWMASVAFAWRPGCAGEHGATAGLLRPTAQRGTGRRSAAGAGAAAVLLVAAAGPIPPACGTSANWNVRAPASPLQVQRKTAASRL